MLAGRVAATLAAAGYSSIFRTSRWNCRFIRAPKLAGATGLTRDICSKLRCNSTSSRDETKNSKCGRQQGRTDASRPAVSSVRLRIIRSRQWGGRSGGGRAGKADLIILDYNMPVMDGVSMLRRLREHADLRRTPVIMLTGELSAENIATVARLGVRDYITKPFDERLLLAKAARAISLVARPSHDRCEREPDPQSKRSGDAQGPVSAEDPEPAPSLSRRRPPSAAPLQRASSWWWMTAARCGSA